VLLLVLRVLLYIQLLLGLFRYAERFGLPSIGRLFDVHVLIGVIVAILAIIALRSVPGVRNTGIRIAARFFPLLPLLLGFGFQANVVPTHYFVILHMILGIATIGLIEAASAQQRRAQRRRRSFAG
jgi:hypothetical protein